MERIEEQPYERRLLGLKILSWLFEAKRPMLVEELRYALAVEPCDISLDIENLPSRKHIVDVCAGLVIIDYERDIIRLVHFSVQEYFRRTKRRWFPNAELTIAKTCMAYLAFEEFGCGPCLTHGDLERRLSNHPFLSYAAYNWGSHVQESPQGDIEESTLSFLENPSKVMASAQVLDSHENGSPRCCQMFPSTNICVQLASRFGIVGFVKLLLDRGHTVKDHDPIGRTALHWAARGGYEDVVKLLLEHGADPNAATQDGRTPLHWAAKHGHTAVMRELLIRAADAGSQTVDGRTALHWAASRGHEIAVRMLLFQEKVDANVKAQNGWTALHWAATSGNRAGVSLSLQRGQDTVQGPKARITINGGAAKGHEAVVLLLLNSGVDPNVRNKYNQTALHWAAASGNEKIIRLLLDHMADPDVRDIYGSTAMHFAADSGAEGPLRLLQSKSADSDAHARNDSIDLDFSAVNEHKTAPDLLLERIPTD